VVAVGWLAGWLAGWLDCSLAGWAGWLAGEHCAGKDISGPERSWPRMCLRIEKLCKKYGRANMRKEKGTTIREARPLCISVCCVQEFLNTQAQGRRRRLDQRRRACGRALAGQAGGSSSSNSFPPALSYFMAGARQLAPSAQETRTFEQAAPLCPILCVSV